MLACCPKLTSLTITHNKLESVEDIIELAQISGLVNLNLSHNRLNDPSIVDQVFAPLPDLVSNLNFPFLILLVSDYISSNRKIFNRRIILRYFRNCYTSCSASWC